MACFSGVISGVFNRPQNGTLKLDPKLTPNQVFHTGGGISGVVSGVVSGVL